MAGTLAITGVGIVGVGGFAGFHSKDSILEAAYASGSELGGFAFWCGIIAALMTRLLFMAAGVPDLLRRAALGGFGAYPACGAWRS